MQQRKRNQALTNSLPRKQDATKGFTFPRWLGKIRCQRLKKKNLQSKQKYLTPVLHLLSYFNAKSFETDSRLDGSMCSTIPQTLPRGSSHRLNNIFVSPKAQLSSLSPPQETSRYNEFLQVLPRALRLGRGRHALLLPSERGPGSSAIFS